LYTNLSTVLHNCVECDLIYITTKGAWLISVLHWDEKRTGTRPVLTIFLIKQELCGEDPVTLVFLVPVDIHM
jgi:hypothetical protein